MVGKILEKCTLLQACEWIAFGLPPMHDIDEFKEYRLLPINYKPAMLRAGNALKYYLNNKQITATGIKAKSRQKVKFPADGTFLHKNSCIISPETGLIYYTDTLINFSELKLLFPHDDFDITEQSKNNLEKDFGRKTTLTNDETVKLLLFAQSISSEHKNLKRFMDICAKWVASEFCKEISLTTIRTYLKPFIYKWKTDKKQKNGK